MKIIIAGCGKVGRTIAEQLSIEKHDVTVIDDKQEVIDSVTTSFDVMGIVGNGASYSVQKEAGVGDADLLIAVTDSDEINLLCCLFAKKAGVVNAIARVRNPQYREEISYIKEELGLAMAINPELAAAREIFRILRFPLANKVETFAGGRIELVSFAIAKESVLCGKSLIEVANMTKSEVLFCAVERDDQVIIPNGSFVLKEHDKASIISSPLAAKQFFSRIGYDTHQCKDTMIIGGGRIGYYLAKDLINMGVSVKIIEKDRARCEELSDLLPKASIICGDAGNKDVLLEEGIQRAQSVVCLTRMDETNAFLALFAKGCNPKAKVVSKINRDDFEGIVKSLDIDTVVCPKDITADTIVGYVRARNNTMGSNVETIYKIIGNNAEALEFKIKSDSAVIGKPLMELKLKDNLLVGCISRGGRTIIANGQTSFAPGDSVIVITTITGLHDFKDIFKE